MRREAFEEWARMCVGLGCILLAAIFPYAMLTGDYFTPLVFFASYTTGCVLVTIYYLLTNPNR